METALEQARLAAMAGEIPVGAVVVHMAGQPEVIAAARNQREETRDPTAHAEVLALRLAAAKLGRWRLDDCLIVVTLEPCPMCAGAMWASRIGAVVMGATNFDAGSLGTLHHLGQDPRLNHEFPVRRGVLEERCSGLLQEFFAVRRGMADAPGHD
jgi:tRNA(adenine34) deaminase